ncbi:hypothetical protein B0H12DRAFT_1079296 [Mycena haematopus]|nr:hypothetical protein B0H12DRAFT_1079296 [Mycena haematopus]
MVLNDPELLVRFPDHNPNNLVQSTDALVAVVGQEAVNYLNNFRGLSDPADIENWHGFCSTHENKKLRDWYAHKIQYPWMLPGFNESLCHFPPGYWQQSPSHTNLVESAHVASNLATSINLPLLESIRGARGYDAERAASIAAGRQTCILPNRHNHDQMRMRRDVTRKAKRASYRDDHDKVSDDIAEDQRRLAAINEEKKTLAARIKDQKAKKKELGRVPRHSTSTRTASDVPALASGQKAPAFWLWYRAKAEPKYRPDTAFGPAWHFSKPKPSRKAPAFTGAEDI